MKAKERHKLRSLEYLGNPDNEWLSRAQMSLQVLSSKRPERIHKIFTPEELSQIESAYGRKLRVSSIAVRNLIKMEVPFYGIASGSGGNT